MALNITTDYAVRILLYLASNPTLSGSISGKEISEEMKIPYNYFLKIVPNLKNAGLLISYQGKKGGYSLKKDPEEITIFEIINAMNDTLSVSECLNNPAACSRGYSPHCAVHDFFDSIQSFIDQNLKSMTLAKVIDAQSQLDEKCGLDCQFRTS